ASGTMLSVTGVTSVSQPGPRTGAGSRGGPVAETGGRAVRADAVRNRARLLDAAVRAFASDGAEVTLDTVARSAGVGIGTLYRHFPTREALVEAAYRQELARLCDAVPGLLGSLPPDEAIRAWMDGFIDYMTTKRYMAEALRA